MASISSVSSTSSLYGNRNVISGLASGMDTESMIENAVSGYKMKISALQQKRTKTEWKQEAYRSMINKMSVFSSKYASYMSSNNLMSASFFNSAVKTVTKGKYADKVTATGRASSDIQINSVKQMATAATYTVSGSKLDPGTADFSTNTASATALEAMDLDGTTKVNGFSGSMTLTYGGSSSRSYLSINFDENKTYASAQELADEINNQLKTQTITIGNNSYTGDELLKKVIKAEVDDNGNITFADPKGNNVYISGASDSVKEKLLGGAELSSDSGKQVKALTIDSDSLKADEVNTLQRLASKGSMEVTLDGVTKTVKMPTMEKITEGMDADLKAKIENGDALTDDEKKVRDEAFVKALNTELDKAFGGKLKVSDANGGEAGIQLQFSTTQKGSTISVKSSFGKELGLGESKQVSSYVNTGKTLGELLGKDYDWSKLSPAKAKDADGKETSEPAVDANGDTLYSFMVNGKEVGQFNANSKLSDVFNAMNSSSDSEVKVGYSKLTNTVTFTAKETGANSKVEFSGLAADLFDPEPASGTVINHNFADNYGFYLSNGEKNHIEVHFDGFTLGFNVDNKMTMEDFAKNIYEISGKTMNVNYNEKTGELTVTDSKGKEQQFTITDQYGFNYKREIEPVVNGKYTKGQDAIMDVTIDGTKIENFTRSSNNIDLDGLTVTLKGTFETAEDEEAVTFQTSADADKIVDVVKKMVEDYNSMVTEIKNAYSTLPAQQSNGKYYEPMTSEEESKYSESYVKSWTEKAQQGLLFGDRDLANLYSSLTDAISLNGKFGATLRNAGITVSYSNGLSTLDFDEEKFRAALDKDPDAVRDAFVSSTDAGSSANGLMAALKKPLDMYGKTSGGKGILVEKAGSPLAASSMYSNTIQQELDEIDSQISKWQDKMSNKVDYYTNQFSKLEQLINQMNSQSSYFSQLSGG